MLGRLNPDVYPWTFLFRTPGVLFPSVTSSSICFRFFSVQKTHGESLTEATDQNGRAISGYSTKLAMGIIIIIYASTGTSVGRATRASCPDSRKCAFVTPKVNGSGGGRGTRDKAIIRYRERSSRESAKKRVVEMTSIADFSQRRSNNDMQTDGKIRRRGVAARAR